MTGYFSTHTKPKRRNTRWHEVNQIPKTYQALAIRQTRQGIKTHTFKVKGFRLHDAWRNAKANAKPGYQVIQITRVLEGK
jgi:hypothetical protein